MLIKLKANIPELFVGIFLTVAVFAMGMLFESQRHLTNQPSTANAKQIQQSHDQIAFSWDWLTRDGTVFFTCVLAFIAGIQAYLFIRQLRYMNEGMIEAARAAKAADLSARAAIALELPLVRISLEKDGYGRSQNQDGTTTSYHGIHSVIYSNHGRTRASPLELKYGWTVGQKLPKEPVYLKSRPFQIGDVFEADPKATMETYLRDAEIEIPEDGYNQIRAGIINLWFYCQLSYLDFMETRHEIGFCWQRYETFGKGGFRRDDTAAYNRKT